jgi:Diguanylate cyclase, GGDEF domain
MSVTASFVPRLRAGARSEEWISAVRVAVLLLLIPALWFGVIPVTHPAGNAIVELFGAYVIVLALGPRWLPALRKPDLMVASDILVITAVVFISGSLHSPFVYLYYLTILEAAARLNLRQAIAACLAMAGMIVFLWARAGQVATLQSTGFRLGTLIAGGFFLALFLSVFVQEYRATEERAAWAEELERRLRHATGRLEEQLGEMQFYNDLGARLSGELRVVGVLEILLQAFLDTVGLPKGVAYVLTEEETPQFAAAVGADWERGDPDVEIRVFPALPSAQLGDDVIIDSAGEAQTSGRHRAFLPLLRAGSLRAWLCGVGPELPSLSDAARGRLRGLATQGVSALEAARLYEEVQRMVSINPTRTLYPWNGLQKLIAEEIRRSTELVLVFSLGEVVLEDYAGATWSEDRDRDLVLRRVVKILQSSLRRVDVVAHDGAGRFVLLLSRVSKMQAVEILRRVTQKLEEDSVAARLLEVSRLRANAGVVTFPEDGSSSSDLFDKLRGLTDLGASIPGRVHVPTP